MDINDPRLTAFVLGELDGAEREALAAELDDSPELRREVDAIREGVNLLAAGLESEPCPALTDNQRELIDQGCAGRGDIVPASPSSGTGTAGRGYWPFLVAAACAILLAAILVPPSNWQSRQAAQSPAVAESVGKLERTGSGGQDAKNRSVTIGLSEDDFGSELFEQRSFDNDFDGALGVPSTASEPADASSDEAASNGPAFNELAPRGVGDSTDLEMGEVDERGGLRADANAEKSGSGRGGFGSGQGGMGGGGGMGADMGGATDRWDDDGIRQRGGNRSARDGETLPPLEESEPSADDLQRASIGTDSQRIERERDFQSAVKEAEEDLAEATERVRVTEVESRLLREAAREVMKREKLNRDAVRLQQRNRASLSDAGAVSAQPLGEARRMPLANQPSSPIAERALAESRGGKATNAPAAAAPATRPQAQSELRTGKPRTWRRARATPNASRLIVGDRDELAMEGMQVNVLVDGFRARVLLDLYYFNDRGRRLEGNFKLRLPNDASLYYFAFGESAYEYRPQVDQLAAKGFLSSELVRAATLNPAGIRQARAQSWSNVKEARLVPRAKAAHAYSETVRRRVDPALVEWSGAGVFNARVFPLMPKKLHRIVVGYDVTLQERGDELSYRLDLPAELNECFVDLNVAALPGMTAEVTPTAQPFLASGRAYYRFANPDERAVEVRLLQPGHVLLAGKDGAAGEVFATRLTPPLPADEATSGAPRAIFLVDTSLSSRPEKFNVWLNLLEQVLGRNRDSMKEFAVLFFNIETHWWQESFAENTPDEVDRLLSYCHSLSLEGATDLRQALRESSAPSWSVEEKGPTAVDRFLLSDGAATWGETNLARIADAVGGSELGALFAYKTGMTGTATSALEYLTRGTGGAVFSVAGEDEIAAAARAHRQRPWRLLDVFVPGGSDLLVAGRPQFIYPGQSLLVVGRGQVETGPVWRVRRGDEERVIETCVDRLVESELAPRLYGQVSVGQLEDLGADVVEVAEAYARHFRVTGQSCSLLMLESEADYQRFHIKPEDDAFVVRSSPSASLVSQKLAELTTRLSDAKVLLTSWLSELERTPGMKFRLPTALRLAIERMPAKSFDVTPASLVCKQRRRGGVTKKYLEQLGSSRLDYASVSQESQRRFEQHGAGDALRALSNLIERNPGDPVLTRDVAFSAINWGLPGQAYPLLHRVARLRPYEPQTYQAMAHCLAESDRADLAMIFYEVALQGRWHDRYRDINQIVAVEYLDLLRQIVRGQLSSQVPDYVRARLESLSGQVSVERADLVVTMMWNTDRTDVDLHVLEPTGEECFYEHPRTRIGGQITRDVTQGFGPEMYTLVNAKQGSYKILANYFGGDTNRTRVRSKVYVTVYEDFGGKHQRVSRRTVTLNDAKEKRELVQVKIPARP